MKTYISDIIPKIQRFSEKLDNLTLLTNQHWVLLGELSTSKVVYIFRSNNQLLISQNGLVEKAHWEYLGTNAMLIDRTTESYLFKHGFFDENILALKLDGIEEYAFLINETKFKEEINSLEKALEFLASKYLKPQIKEEPLHKNNLEPELVSYISDKGEIFIPACLSYLNQPVFKDGKPAPDGKYRLSLMDHIHVRDGIIYKETVF